MPSCLFSINSNGGHLGIWMDMLYIIVTISQGNSISNLVQIGLVVLE